MSRLKQALVDLGYKFPDLRPDISRIIQASEDRMAATRIPEIDRKTLKKFKDHSTDSEGDESLAVYEDALSWAKLSTSFTEDLKNFWAKVFPEYLEKTLVPNILRELKKADKSTGNSSKKFKVSQPKGYQKFEKFDNGMSYGGVQGFILHNYSGDVEVSIIIQGGMSIELDGLGEMNPSDDPSKLKKRIIQAFKNDYNYKHVVSYSVNEAESSSKRAISDLQKAISNVMYTFSGV
jgi:hypothetical protein